MVEDGARWQDCTRADETTLDPSVRIVQVAPQNDVECADAIGLGGIRLMVGKPVERMMHQGDAHVGVGERTGRRVELALADQDASLVGIAAAAPGCVEAGDTHGPTANLDGSGSEVRRVMAGESVAEVFLRES